MDDFLKFADEDRLAFFNEAAARRDVTPIIIEKDFWVCWTLRRLVETVDVGEYLTFKGGTSLSKAYGIIHRFSEDIDLTIARTAPEIEHVESPMAEGIGRKERDRRAKALKTAAQSFMSSKALPKLAKSIESAIGKKDGWLIKPDPEDQDAQTILFEYPRLLNYGGFGTGGYGAEPDGGSYIKPRIKLEFGARGETEPSEPKTITPYLAQEFPNELPNSAVTISTLAVERTFWEKVTILHALHHGSKLRPEMSRHYYDTIMLARKGIDDRAMADPELLRRVVLNKRLLFPESKASYETAQFGTLRLAPPDPLGARLRLDYEAMTEMFMTEPPSFDELMAGIGSLEAKLNRLLPIGDVSSAN